MKNTIKTVYITKLKETYPGLYLPDSKPLQIAGIAADNALSGRLKLEGVCWEAALLEVTGKKRWTMAELAALPL